MRVNSKTDIVPILGQTKRGKELGCKQLYRKFIGHCCVDCGTLRWVEIYANGQPKRIRCPSCASRGSKDKWDKGITTYLGYIWVWLKPDDFFYPMVPHGKKQATGGYVSQHRLVMAKSLGRCLHSWELVHHKNHNKCDNSLNNLQLVSSDRHMQITILETKIDRLEKEVKLLKWRFKELEAKTKGEVIEGFTSRLR